MSDSSITRKENGEIRIKHDEQSRFAEVFGLELDEFLGLADFKDGRGVKPKGIPVINKVPAGDVFDYNNDQCGMAEYHGPLDEIDRGLVGDPDAEALVVVGDSMLPSVRDGDIVIISPVIDDKPETFPQPADVVFVRYTHDAPEHGCCLARWFPRDRETWLLAKDNRNYPPKIVQQEWISRMGRVIEHRKRGWV